MTWLLDDVGIPQDWRHLEGNSVNTYLFINAQGKERYFKMRWLPTEGACVLGTLSFSFRAQLLSPAQVKVLDFWRTEDLGSRSVERLYEFVGLAWLQAGIGLHPLPQGVTTIFILCWSAVGG